MEKFQDMTAARMRQIIDLMESPESIQNDVPYDINQDNFYTQIALLCTAIENTSCNGKSFLFRTFRAYRTSDEELFNTLKESLESLGYTVTITIKNPEFTSRAIFKISW